MSHLTRNTGVPINPAGHGLPTGRDPSARMGARILDDHTLAAVSPAGKSLFFFRSLCEATRMVACGIEGRLPRSFAPLQGRQGEAGRRDRSIAGPASILVCRVNTVKDAYKHFVAIDAGFNLFVRPAMYDAYHEVVVTNRVNESASVLSTVVGPICESGDILAKDRMLPDVKRGDYIAILDTGAYGFSMSSQYNGRPRCAEVLVKDGAADLIREKESIVDIIRHQVIPERLR